MRPVFKIFTITVLFVFVDSFIYNLNKSWGYCLFSIGMNDMLFGLSYIIPLNVFAGIMRHQSKYFWERIITGVFLWLTFSALLDELFFNPYKPQITEHLLGLTILPIIYYYERFKKVRD